VEYIHYVNIKLKILIK